jgi:hypothetical protein
VKAGEVEFLYHLPGTGGLRHGTHIVYSGAQWCSGSTGLRSRTIQVLISARSHSDSLCP